MYIFSIEREEKKNHSHQYFFVCIQTSSLGPSAGDLAFYMFIVTPLVTPTFLMRNT